MAAYRDELHLHTCYSFLEGASQPEELAWQAGNLGYRSLAITDHDGLHGAIFFAQACKAYELRPITGVELTLRHPVFERTHLTLLAESERGYASLCRLITEAHRKSPDPDDVALDPAELEGEGKTAGLILLTGCRGGELSQLIDRGQFDQARAVAERLIELFGRGNVYVELQHNLVHGDKRRLARLAELAAALELPIVATGNVHYHVRERHRLQDALVAIRSRATLDGSHRQRRPNSEFYLRSPAEVEALFAAYPEAIENTAVISDRCAGFNMADRKELGYEFPEFAREEHERGLTDDQVLAGYCWAQLASRYAFPSAAGLTPLRAAVEAAFPEERLLDVAQAAIQRTGQPLRYASAAFAPSTVFQRAPVPERSPTAARQPIQGGAAVAPSTGLQRAYSAECSLTVTRKPAQRAPVEAGTAVHGTVAGQTSALSAVGQPSSALVETSQDEYAQRLAKAAKQLQAELALVAKHRLAGFFLIYRDLQTLATDVANELRGEGNRRTLPPGRGRGSSVSSIICYLIGLSHVDPVANRLFFRRFLNEDLVAVPDIDLDFAREIREQLILRVYERYGHDHAALVCSFATYHLRSAVRDLGKVLGLPAPAIDKLAKLSEGGHARSLKQELEHLPEFHGQASGPLWQHLIELCEQIDDFPRHVSQHVGGMIISSKPLIEIVPIQPAAWPGRFICQWDKDACDEARFIKIDFLALGMLSLVEECLDMISQNRGEQLDLTSISYDDQAVYDDACRGDTVGTFQIESRAQIQMLPRTQPRNLDDLAVQVAIVRPGPIVADAVNPYVRRREILRQNPNHVFHADHPALDKLLADTLGVILYQDQVLEVAIEIAGFTPGLADQFRRAMSKKRSKENMERFREPFVKGAFEKHGIRERQALAIFEKLAAFSDFGFPKSHAYAFAVLAYQSAWLRHYYMAEYYAALLNNQPMGFYAPNVLINDAQRHGVHVLGVSINRSAARCKPGDNQILLGLGVVRDMSDELAKQIVAEREANGAYLSLPDFLRRVPAPRSTIEHLVAVGAMSEFGLARRELLWQLGLLSPEAPSAPSLRPRKSRPQLPLVLPNDQDMVELPDMTEWERMVADYRLMHLSPRYHPLSLLRPDIPEDVLTAAQLRKIGTGVNARTAGMVVCRQRPGTANGIVFLLMEDETGLTNVVVRPELFAAERRLIRGEPY
ncbi:MAG: DNA polymerase III subunit alpha, partial [Chloroflexi bacterium]|nr:DNA polymerase III subunit alpha [Chloroflexota bacterium]